jgi:tripartite-type tricarboxylate transporter receptor subunit TctC
MKRIIVTLMAAMALLGTSAAQAQAYPVRNVRVIVPFAPGGVADGSARFVANHLTESWGKPFIVDNRPGGGSIIAISAVIKAPADGYTLLHANTNIATNPSIYAKLPYDAERDLVPVALVVLTPGVIVVPVASPVRTLKDLIAMAKRKRGELTYSSVGIGSFPHLAGEQLQQLAGIELNHVPYKGFAPALAAVLSGEVNLLVSDLQGALPHIKAGTLRAIATTGPKRSLVMPDVPTVAELGLTDYEAVGWLGIMAPAGTPSEVVKKLNAEINRGLSTPEAIARFAEYGVDVAPGTPEDFGAFIQRSRKRWSNVITTGGISVSQ